MLRLVALAAALAACTAAVAPRARGTQLLARQPRRICRIDALAERGGDGEPPLPEGEDAAGAEFSTDWDADWRKFQREGSASWRPEGRSAYTTQDLATARATRVLNDMRSSVPSPYELVRDTRFWLAVLVMLALAPSLFTALHAPPRGEDVLI
ncbi:hypothetical protein KFE25_004162 [Diacronema lutheri]|nr:hypothetical protein KFE25_004162 [Diacronema lutheri]